MTNTEKGYLFIRQPYLAMSMAIVVTLCGGLAILGMSVSHYPDITPPQVTVSVAYPGADAKTMLDTVVIPIENQINGAEDMIYLSSTSGNTGEAVITASFKIGTDPMTAKQNVQDRVDWATSQLPQAVQNEGIIVREQTGNILLTIALTSPDNTYTSEFLANYALIHLVQKLKRIGGVSQVAVFGGSDYAMRIWLDEQKLDGFGMEMSEVAAALQAQNIQVTSGTIGSAPSIPGQQRAYVLRTQGRLQSTEDFANIILRAESGGAMVRLKDVATVELGSETYTTASEIDGIPSAQILVFQRSNGNALRISQECRALLDKEVGAFPPGLHSSVFYDSSDFVRTSIRDVVKTLFLAVILVALVTFVFLQDFRMAIIPICAVPVSIIGTFAGLYLLGYSINMITLFGVILAIGIVVDDAIIVIENVSRLLASGKYTPREAAEQSMKEISGAILATTAVLLAMFLPITFMKGITGEIFKQFGITLSLAVTLSAFNALTLSPALCSLILRARSDDGASGTTPFFLFRWFNRGFNGQKNLFVRGLRRILVLAIPIALVYLAGSFFVAREYAELPAGFIPTEDQGVFFGNVQMPTGTSLEETRRVMQRVNHTVREIPGVQSVMSLAGYDILNSIPASENILLIAMLKKEAQRAPARELIKEAQFALMETVPEAVPMLFELPPIPGIGMSDGFNFVLMEPGGTDPQRLSGALDAFLAQCVEKKKLANVYSGFRADAPSWFLEIDREKALRIGLDLESVNQVLQGLIGFEYINQFNRFGQVYKVEIQGRAESRNTAEKILRLNVRNSGGIMIPFSAFAKLRRETVPATLTRYNLALSATIQGEPAKGFSSGEAMREMETLAKNLPDGMTYEWTDMSYQEQKSGTKTVSILFVALIFIYLFLAALYGSWMLPLSVLPLVVVALAGAFGALQLTGGDNNIYTQIGIVLLFGMTCKTAILVINFAKEKYDAEGNAVESAVYAAQLRYRAVMMTAFAFILGTLPLAFAVGGSALSQRAIGTTVVGGMLAIVLVGIWLIPLFFTIIEKILEHFQKPETDQNPKCLDHR